MLDNVQAWQFIVAFVSPYLVALINRPSWSAEIKRLVMIVVSTVIALGTAAINGQFASFDWSQVLQYIVMMIGATQVAFSVLTRVSVTKTSLDKVEVAASGSTPAEAVVQKAEVKQAEVRDFEQNVAA